MTSKQKLYKIIRGPGALELALAVAGYVHDSEAGAGGVRTFTVELPGQQRPYNKAEIRVKITMLCSDGMNGYWHLEGRLQFNPRLPKTSEPQFIRILYDISRRAGVLQMLDENPTEGVPMEMVDMFMLHFAEGG